MNGWFNPDYRKIVMAISTYRCYDDRSVPNLWAKWHDGQSGRCKGTHSTVFDFIEQVEILGPPHTKKIKSGDGVVEVIIKAELQWRIFGFRTGNVFTVVAIGYHKGRVYTPRDVLKTAKKRMNLIKSGKAEAKNCERPE